MPVRRFWVMNNNIEKIQAQQNLRLLSLMNGSQSKEGSEQLIEHLNGELGDVVVYENGGVDLEPELDREGLEALRLM